MAQTKAQLLNPLNGNVNVSGIVTSGGFKVGTGISIVGSGIAATAFYGDGSALTNTGSTLSAGSGSQRVVLTGQSSGTMTSVATDAELTYNSDTDTLTATNFSGSLTGTATGLSGTPNITVGNISASGGDLTIRNITGAAATFTGVLTYEDVTNVDSLGVVTARSGIHFGVAGAGGTITDLGHAEFIGVCTASSFVKEGGTSSQFLKADGSTDDEAYANTGKSIAMSIVFG